MVSWLTVAVLALTCVVYAAFCAAVVRAFFRTRVNRTAYRAAGAWAACFGVTLVGSLMALEALQRACGVADLRMSDYGISPDEFPAMVRNARETMGFLFPFDREPLSDEECEAIYRASYR